MRFKVLWIIPVLVAMIWSLFYFNRPLSIDWTKVMQEALADDEVEDARPAVQWLGSDQFGLVARYRYAQDRERGFKWSDWEPLCDRVCGGGAVWKDHLECALSQELESQSAAVPLVQEPDELIAYMLHAPDQPVYYAPSDKEASLSQQRLLAKGYSRSDLDRIAIEYCRLRSDTYVAVVSTNGYRWRHEIERILNLYGSVIYRKQFTLSGNGPANLMTSMYSVLCDNPHQWVHSARELRREIRNRFSEKDPLQVYVFQCPSYERARQCKQAVRKYLKMGSSLIHMTGSQSETVSLAQLLLDDDHIDQLNQS